jgi:RHS repeat-associated protein
MGKTAFFSGGRLEKKGDALKNRYNYYPFGLTFNSYQRSYSKANNFKYNGKEEQEETGWYDYGARYYDATISRFTTLDPKAETYNNWTPYLYAANNPIRYEDTNGEGPGDGIFGDLISSAKTFLVNAVTETVKSAIKVFAEDVNDARSEIDASPYVEVKAGYKAQAGAALSAKGVGVDANGDAKDAFSINFSADKDGSSFEVNYLNKDGESDKSKGLTAGYLGSGGYTESSTIDNETGEVKKTTKSSEITVGAGVGLTMKGEQTKTNESTKYTGKAAATAGGSAGVGIVGYGSIEIGVKITTKDQEYK